MDGDTVVQMSAWQWAIRAVSRLNSYGYPVANFHSGLYRILLSG